MEKHAIFSKIPQTIDYEQEFPQAFSISQYKNLDCIYSTSIKSGKVFVGTQIQAYDSKLLQ